jgi:hypothetical protein
MWRLIFNFSCIVFIIVSHREPVNCPTNVRLQYVILNLRLSCWLFDCNEEKHMKYLHYVLNVKDTRSQAWSLLNYGSWTCSVFCDELVTYFEQTEAQTFSYELNAYTIPFLFPRYCNGHRVMWSTTSQLLWHLVVNVRTCTVQCSKLLWPPVYTFL